MGKENNIYLAGHRGMVGSAIERNLNTRGDLKLITATSSQLDLRNQGAVNAFFEQHRPDVVIIAAARVGGILANREYPWPFLYDNLMIEANLIHAAHQNEVQNLIFLGSSCIYPKHADQPMKEESLLTGPLEPTNEWYAIAKITGIKLCQALNRQYGRRYISLMPTNLYGPRDNFDLETSHVLPAMIRKFHEAKVNNHAPVTLWGTGTPMREFLHVDDLAGAVRFVMECLMENVIPTEGVTQDAKKTENTLRNTPRNAPRNVNKGEDAPRNAPQNVNKGEDTPRNAPRNVNKGEDAPRNAPQDANKPEDVPVYDMFNVGTGTDLPIKALAKTVQDIIGHRGEIHWDRSKPDGTPRKLLDVSRIHALGWEASMSLEDGIRNTYKWLLENKEHIREVKVL